MRVQVREDSSWLDSHASLLRNFPTTSRIAATAAATFFSKTATYRRSSAGAHVFGAADPLLSPARPYPGPVADWREWLLDPGEEKTTQRLRLSTKTGRPCGDASFVARLEQRLGRILRPLKRGPKPKSKEEEKGQTDLFGTTG